MNSSVSPDAAKAARPVMLTGPRNDAEYREAQICEQAGTQKISGNELQGHFTLWAMPSIP